MYEGIENCNIGFKILNDTSIDHCTWALEAKCELAARLPFLL